jgi:Fe-S cluster assembly scaffold protein SufB
MKKIQSRGVRLAAFGAAAALVLGLAVPAHAGERAVAGVHGMQVAIDAHGKLRQPTAAESQALAVPFTAKAGSAPQFTAWADGTISMVLTPDYLNVWLVGLNADGSANQVCVDGYNAATVQPAPALEEK